MGMLNVIKNCEKEAPTQELPENDDLFDVEEDPVVVNIYSDSSTDTESLDDELLEVYSCSSFENLDDHLDTENVLITMNDVEEPAASEVLERVEKMQTNLFRKMHNISSKSRSSNMGRRKARRFENARQLDLMVGDDYKGDCDINDFMPITCSFRFTRILEDNDLADEILNPAKNGNNDTETRMTNSPPQKKKPQSSKTRKVSPEMAFNNLDPSEKTLFKRRNLPMGMVQYLDTCVFSFFENNPTGTYVSEPLSSFERLMLHSIAHYYELNSFSYNVDNCSTRFTKVTNTLNYFNPPCLCLSRYLEEQLVKNSGANPAKRRRVRRR